MRTRAVFVVLSIIVGALSLPAAEAPAPPTKPIALIHARVCSRGPAGDFTGTVLVSGGKVTALGADVAVPADARRIDCSNCVVTPGLIDARSQLWLNAAAAKEQGRDAGLNILDAVDPYDDRWRDAAAQGVTAVYVQPVGSLGGAGAVLRVAPATTVDDVALKTPVAVQAALGLAVESPRPQQNDQLAALLARFGITMPQQPASTPSMSNALTRYSQYESLKGQLDSAKRYGESKSAKKDATKDLLVRVLKKEIPLRLECGHEDDVRNALKLADELSVRIVFEHLDRVKPMPEELTSSRSPIVIGRLLSGNQSDEMKKLALDGRRFAIGTYGDDHESAWLRANAAAAVAIGFQRDRILSALTSDAADMLGVGDRLGRIAVGRPADLVVFAGEPLDPGTAVRLTMSQGTVTYENVKASSRPPRLTVKAAIPERLPARYILKTTHLLNAAGEFAPGELYVQSGHLSDPAGKPADTPVIDVGDAPVTPGLVAAMVGLSGEEFPDANAAHLRALDGLMPDDARLKTLRDAGFLSAIVAPGSSNVVAGCIGVIRAGEVGGGTDGGMKFVLSAQARKADRYPSSLVGQIELIDQWLRGEPSGSELYLPQSVLDQLTKVRSAPTKELREKKVPAYFEVGTRAEAHAALKLIHDHGLRGVLVTPRQLDGLTDDILTARAGVIIAPSRSDDSVKVREQVAALAKAGVPLAVAGSDPAEIQQTLAWQVNGGLERAAARKALFPGEAFGLAASAVSFAPGGLADCIVWNGDPVDPGARPLAVLVGGQRQEKHQPCVVRP